MGGPSIYARPVFLGGLGHRKLRHHTRVFMFQDVAVQHVWRFWWCFFWEADKDIGRTARKDRNRVFPALHMRRWLLSVERENPKLAAMYVDWMQHAIAPFINPPSKQRVLRHVDAIPIDSKGLPIDGVGRKLGFL